MREHNSDYSFNILTIPLVKRIVQSRCFPYLLQFIALIVFLLLVVNGIIAGVPESLEKKFALTIKKTNLTTLFIWGVWWPCLVLTTIFFNRLWCVVCPMELVTNISKRFSKKIGLKGFSLPRWTQKGFLILSLYIIMQLLVNGFQVHRIPLYSAYVFLGMLSTAVFVGFTFREPRAFCKGFCPASLLLNTYSRLTPISLRVNNGAVCNQCKVKECVISKNRFNLDARSCPNYLRPYALDQNDGCVCCFQCAKICPYHNIGFGVLKGRLKERLTKSVPLASVLFIFIASGFVSHELFAETPILEKVFHAIPEWAVNITGVHYLFPWIEAFWFLAMFPLFIISGVLILNYFFGKHLKIIESLTNIAFPLIPVVAAGHATKAIIKLNQWIGHLPNTLSDPIGMVTAKKILNGTIREFPPLFPGEVIGVCIGIVFFSAFIIANKIIRDTFDVGSKTSAYLSVITVLSLYCFVSFSSLVR